MRIETRDARIADALDLVAWQARRFPRLPRGITTDDLESAGNEALIHAATTWDDEGEIPWRTWARKCVRNAMLLQIRHARTRRSAPLEVEGEDGELLPRADPRAADPAELASAREVFSAPPAASTPTPGRPRRHISLSGAPDPAAVAIRATALREAMFGAIRDEDAADVVRQVMEKAKGGDLKAARLFFDLLAPSRSGATVIQQQAVVIREGDLP